MRHRRIHQVGRDGSVQRIWVFSLDKEKVEFTPEEKRLAKSDKGMVVWVNAAIHEDDTNDILRRKIFHHTGVMYEDMYLYYKRPLHYKVETVYETLLEFSGADHIRRSVMQTFCKNLGIPCLMKETFHYHDVETIMSNVNEIEDSVGISVKRFSNHIIPYVCVNPSRYADEDLVHLSQCTNYVTSNINAIACSSDIIYLTSFQDLLTEKKYDDDNFIRCMFPYLMQVGVRDFASYHSKLKARQKTSSVFYNIELENAYKSIDTIKKFGASKCTDSVVSEGITRMQFHVYPSKSLQLNLLNLFKMCHASRQTPFMCYFNKSNPFVRVYSEQVDQYGRQMQFMPMSKIRYLLKEPPVRECIRAFGEHDGFEITIDLMGTGVAKVYLDRGRRRSDLDIESVKYYIHNVFRDAIHFFGIDVSTFLHIQDIADPALGLDTMNYEWTIKCDKTASIVALKECISLMNDVFILNEKQATTTSITTYFRRVSNFSITDSVDTQIITMLNSMQYTPKQIKNRVAERYNLSDMEVSDRFSQIVNRSEFNTGRHLNAIRKIRTNPGFETTFMIDNLTGMLEIKCIGINATEYINSLRHYICVLAHMFLRPNEAKELRKLIHTDITIENSSSRTPSDVTSEVDKAFMNESPDVYPTSNVVDFITHADEYQSLIEMSVVTNDKVLDNPEAADNTDPIEIGDASAEEEKLDDFLRSMYGDDQQQMTTMFEDDEDQYTSATRINGVVNDPVVVDEEDTLAGGALSNDTVDFDIRTYTLHPNPIITRLERKDPPLFKSKGKQTYAQSCQATHRKQPVVFDEEDMKHVRKHHREAYGDELLYRGYFYICPRFFSIRHNAPLTHEQVKSKKYGTMLPLKLPNKRQQARLDPNANIMEFTSKDHIDKMGNYINKSPGLMKPSKHPHGLCMPCCVSAFNGEEQVRRRKQCIDSANVEQTINAELPAVQKYYVLSPMKTTIPYHRYGHITPSIASLLGKPKKEHAFVKYGTNHSVFSPTCKSFLSAIADVYSQGKMTLSEMRETLLKAATLDYFVAAQNGGLVKIFANIGDIAAIDPDSADGKAAMTPHKGTIIYEKLVGKTDNERRTLMIMCIACNNFRDYVNHSPCTDDDGHFLDYRYLWDLVCMPNPNLFPEGINLILLKSSNDVDITTNMRMVCPTGSSHYADMKRGFVIVYKDGALYDPIYVVKLSKDRDMVAPDSTVRVVHMSEFPGLQRNFNHLVASMQTACVSTGIAGYKFQQPVPANDVARAAKGAGYTVVQQLMHYTGVVVALLVRGPANGEGVVPTAPSSALPDVDVVTMDYQLPVWNDYATTHTFLSTLHHATNELARCKPSVKVVERDMVVGILTMANQFVPIAAPEMNTQSDGLPVLDGYNYAAIDNADASRDVPLDASEELYLRIKLETEYYRCFKNVINKHIKSYQLDEHHRNILNIIANDAHDTTSRIDAITTIIRGIVGSIVTFSEFSDKAVARLIRDVQHTGTRKHTICSIIMHEDTTPLKHVFPKRNVLDDRDNEVLYYHRYADEIIRYPFLRLHIMQRTNDMPLENLDWSVNADELLTTPMDIESMHMQKRTDNLSEGHMYSNYPRDMRSSVHAPNEHLKMTNVFGILKELLNVEAQELVRTGTSSSDSICMFNYLFDYASIESYYPSESTVFLNIWRNQGKGGVIDKLTTISTSSVLHAVLKSDSNFVTLMDYVAAANNTSYGLIVYFTSTNAVLKSNIAIINPTECNGYVAMIKVTNNIIENTPQEIRVVLIDGKSPFIHQSTIPEKLRAAFQDHRHTYEEYMQLYKDHLERSKNKIAIVRDAGKRIRIKIK